MEQLFTVKEVSKILKTNTNYVYELIRKGYLKCLKLGSYKVRESTLAEFVANYEGYDLTNADEPKKMNIVREE